MNCTWKKEKNHYICIAKKCPHNLKNGGCELGKVSLTCDNTDCKYNKIATPGIYVCISMDIHLGANGECLLKKSKKSYNQKR